MTASHRRDDARRSLVRALEDASSAATRWLEHYLAASMTERDSRTGSEFYMAVTHALDTAAEEVPR